MQHLLKLYSQVVFSQKLTIPYYILNGFVADGVENIILKINIRRGNNSSSTHIHFFLSHLPRLNLKNKTKNHQKLK